MSSTSQLGRDWEAHYRNGHMPWDSGRPSAELQAVLAEFDVPRGRALELGCGTGTNAVWLAGQGFAVTAVDCSETALSLARQRADEAGVEVEWIAADVANFGRGRPQYDLLFDRGCYHCCRRVDLAGYLETHQHVTRPGAWTLVLAGNPNDGAHGNMPQVTAAQLALEFEALYRIERLREFSFEDAGGVRGPLGWSCLMRRR